MSGNVPSDTWGQRRFRSACTIMQSDQIITWSYNTWHWALWHNMDYPCKNVYLGICGQRRPRSALRIRAVDQGLHWPLTKSLDITECIVQKPRRYFAHAQDNLNAQFAHVRRQLFRLTRFICRWALRQHWNVTFDFIICRLEKPNKQIVSVLIL